MLTFYQSQIALGSEIDLALVSDADRATVDEWFRKLWLLIFKFEKLASRFLTGSELSQLNRMAGARRSASPQFRAVLKAALTMAEQTGGLYNPFVLPALQKAGYTQSMVAAYAKDAVDDYSSRGITTYNKLEIGDTWVSIPYGTALDLGGCGKGYIGDKLARLAVNISDIAGYWFSLGGDIVAGGLNEEGQPWTVGIDVSDQEQPMVDGQVKLPDNILQFAVATSSVKSRKGLKNGKTWHHIIDPRTGQPSTSDVVAATVCAPSALAADVLASCAIILGSQAAPAFLKSKNVNGFLLRTKNNHIRHWGKYIEVF